MDITDITIENIEDIRAFRYCDEYERRARTICAPAYYTTRSERQLAINTTTIKLCIEELQRRRW